jgi:hypothetical protein
MRTLEPNYCAADSYHSHRMEENPAPPCARTRGAELFVDSASLSADHHASPVRRAMPAEDDFDISGGNIPPSTTFVTGNNL